jgi:hypothetical protein
MNITEPIYKNLLYYSLMALFMSGFIWFLEGFNTLEKHFIPLVILGFLLILFCLVAKYFNKVQSVILNKKLPYFIQIPISEYTLHNFNQTFGLYLFIFANLSIVFTNIIWIFCLFLSIFWSYFSHHPYVWLKDSFDLNHRINHFYKYKKTLEDGVFEYPNTFNGFIYYAEDSQQKIKVAWCEVLSIDIQNIDLFTHFEIKLIVLTKQCAFQIYESTEGYLKFYDQLENNLKNFESLKMLVYLSGDYTNTINLYKK